MAQNTVDQDMVEDQSPMMIQVEQDHALKEDREETHLETVTEMNIEILQDQEKETEIEDTKIEAAAGRVEEAIELKGLEGKAMEIQGDSERIARSP